MPNSNINVEKKVLRYVLTQIVEGIIVTDMHRKIVEFSKGASDLTGYPYLEALDQPLDKILKLFKEDAQISVDECCPIEEFEIEGTIFNEDNLKLIQKDGETTKIVKVNVQKMKEGNEGNIGCIFTIMDKSKEAELERMKLDFISMSAHVLRTPITILRGYSQILLRESTIAKLDQVEVDSINQIATSSDDLRDRVENMLNLANIKEGNIEIHPIAMSLENTVKSVIESYRPNAKDKNLELQYIPPTEPLPRGYAEIGKVKEVLSKLIDNGIKFTNSGAVTIEVKRDGEFLVTSIKDSGVGIPEGNLSQVFTKFYRVKQNALDMASGNGLSLYTSKKLITAMGGQIGVESNEGKGSRFYFTIPIYKEDLHKVSPLI